MMPWEVKVIFWMAVAYFATCILRELHRWWNDYQLIRTLEYRLNVHEERLDRQDERNHVSDIVERSINERLKTLEVEVLDGKSQT
jgi:hypothetical protein